MSRNARPTACLGNIAKLHEQGRLLRCYTQNVDGLQTRGRPHLAEVVLELHGNIRMLRCNRCSSSPEENEQEIDRHLQQDGYVHCKKCQQRAGLSGRWEFRSFPPGLLLPQVLHNDGSWEPQSNGMSLGQLEQADGSAALLLVIGTSIRTDGAAKLVRSLAKKVHQGGGVVVYIDRAALPDRKWGEFVDVHLQMELDKWALDALCNINASMKGEDHIDTKQEVMEVLNSLYNWDSNAPPIKNSSNNHNTTSLGSDNQVQGPRTSYTSKAINRVILVCHSGAAALIAHTMAVQLVSFGEASGWQCHAYVVVLSGSADDLTSVPLLENYQLIVVHISDYVFRLHNTWRAVETGQGIQELLTQSVGSMGRLSEQSNGQLLLMICAEDELLSLDGVARLQETFEQQSTFDMMIASLNLSKLKISGWAKSVVDIASFQMQNCTDPVNNSAIRWMSNKVAYENSDLVVFTRATGPTMLLASLADRPMGKSNGKSTTMRQLVVLSRRLA
ncbi:hypothetical protein RSAG8_09746, partial [Rhizoctonia solani AG-8 WAC10335]